MKRLLQLHLWCGVILGVFTAMYGVTGLAVFAGYLFPDYRESVEVERRISVEKSVRIDQLLGADRAAGARALQRAFDLGGRRRELKRSDDGRWFLATHRPGVNETLEWEPATGAGTIVVETAGLRSRLNRLHHFHGYHGELRHLLWAVMVDVTALAMIFFATSGVILWYTLNRKRMLGWALLVVTSLFTVVTLATYV